MKVDSPAKLLRITWTPSQFVSLPLKLPSETDMFLIKLVEVNQQGFRVCGEITVLLLLLCTEVSGLESFESLVEYDSECLNIVGQLNEITIRLLVICVQLDNNSCQKRNIAWTEAETHP